MSSLIYQKLPTTNAQVRPSSFIHPAEKNGVDKIVNFYLKGTDEVKNILRTECEVIFECSFCRSLFRNITNFISHSRTICHRSRKNAQEIVNGVKSSQNFSIVQQRPQELVNGVKSSKNASIVQRPQELVNGVKASKNASIAQHHDHGNDLKLSQTGPIAQRSRGRPRSMPYPKPTAPPQQSSTISSKSLIVPLKTSTPKMVKEKMAKKSDEKTNKTLGSALHITPPNTCCVCNQSLNSTGAKIKHIWGHIQENTTSKDPKDVYSYYCDVPSCNFLTNFIEEAKFHKMEGHTVVDNHETTDELFSAAIKQCFDDLNESLEEKIYKMRHYRESS